MDVPNFMSKAFSYQSLGRGALKATRIPVLTLQGMIRSDRNTLEQIRLIRVLSSTNIIRSFKVEAFARSLICIINNTGQRTEPWETRHFVSNLFSELLLKILSFTLKYCLHKTFIKNFIKKLSFLHINFQNSFQDVAYCRIFGS